ncbi:Uncharacterised protein [Mycobacteroides abscessus subsp. abscessus]|nr:Uncharacterised protein [Mycobacteroides abscessus subsp. abscessus]
MQIDAIADARPQRAGVVNHPRCAGKVLGTTGGGETVGDPHSQVHAAAALIGAGLDA